MRNRRTTAMPPDHMQPHINRIRALVNLWARIGIDLTAHQHALWGVGVTHLWVCLLEEDRVINRRYRFIVDISIGTSICDNILSTTFPHVFWE